MLLTEIALPDLIHMIETARTEVQKATLLREFRRRTWSPPSPEDCDDGGVDFADDLIF